MNRLSAHLQRSLVVSRLALVVLPMLARADGFDKIEDTVNYKAVAKRLIGLTIVRQRR